MKRPLKKSLPSRPMKPASRKPIEISFQSICQSPRKLCATSDQAPDFTLPDQDGIFMLAVTRVTETLLA